MEILQKTLQQSLCLLPFLIYGCPQEMVPSSPNPSRPALSAPSLPFLLCQVLECSSILGGAVFVLTNVFG